MAMPFQNTADFLQMDTSPYNDPSQSSSESHVGDGRFWIRRRFRMAQIKPGRLQNQTSQTRKKKKSLAFVLNGN